MGAGREGLSDFDASGAGTGRPEESVYVQSLAAK